MILRLAKCIARGEEFGVCLAKILEEKGISVSEFARKAGIPHSTLYKILKGEKPRYDTLSKIFAALHDHEKFVAVIAARYVLEEMKFGSSVKVYSATTLEDAIVAAVRAEKDGAAAIVCAPILSSVVERMVDVPVITIKPSDSLRKAVELAIKKIS